MTGQGDTGSLFEHGTRQFASDTAPLAERMRPATFDEFVGQEHILAEDKVLRRAIANDRIPSILLWGPPGSGKTTLARLIATVTRAHFEPVSAVSAGVADFAQSGRRRPGNVGRFTNNRPSCSWMRSIVSTRRSRT